VVRRNPPPAGPPDDAIPPPELVIGPCIEVWAPPPSPPPRDVGIGGVPPEFARMCAARRRWGKVANEWRDSRNLTEPFEVLPDRGDWSVDGASAQWHFDRLGMTRAEVLALRPVALAYDMDAIPHRRYDPATGRMLVVPKSPLRRQTVERDEYDEPAKPNADPQEVSPPPTGAPAHPPRRPDPPAASFFGSRF
jgi:hypothetical protein